MCKILNIQFYADASYTLSLKFSETVWWNSFSSCEEISNKSDEQTHVKGDVERRGDLW